MEFKFLKISFLFIVVVLSGIVSCIKIQDEKDVIYILNLITDAKRDVPYLDSTLLKSTTQIYLNRETNIVNVDILSGNKDSLKEMFNGRVLVHLIRSLDKGYEQKSLKKVLSEDKFVVSENELPDFLNGKDVFPPFAYNGYYSATRVSTPIIHKDKAMVLESSITGNDLGVSIFFLMKDNENSTWKVVGKGLIHETRFYQQ